MIRLRCSAILHLPASSELVCHLNKWTKTTMRLLKLLHSSSHVLDFLNQIVPVPHSHGPSDHQFTLQSFLSIAGNLFHIGSNQLLEIHSSFYRNLDHQWDRRILVILIYIVVDAITCLSGGRFWGGIADHLISVASITYWLRAINFTQSTTAPPSNASLI